MTMKITDNNNNNLKHLTLIRINKKTVPSRKVFTKYNWLKYTKMEVCMHSIKQQVSQEYNSVYKSTTTSPSNDTNIYKHKYKKMSLGAILPMFAHR